MIVMIIIRIRIIQSKKFWINLLQSHNVKNHINSLQTVPGFPGPESSVLPSDPLDDHRNTVSSTKLNLTHMYTHVYSGVEIRCAYS